MTSASPRSRRKGTFAARSSTFQVALGVVLLAGAVWAAVTVVYNTPSTLTFEVKEPPVIWVAGPDSSGNNFVSSFALSSNATYFNVTLKPVSEANVTWGNFTTLKNNDSVAYTVTVSGDSLSGYAKVLIFRMEFRNYGNDTLMGTLDLKAGSPSAALGSMAAAAQFYTKAYMKLDQGTSDSDLPATSTVSLTIA